MEKEQNQQEVNGQTKEMVDISTLGDNKVIDLVVPLYKANKAGIKATNPKKSSAGDKSFATKRKSITTLVSKMRMDGTFLQVYAFVNGHLNMQ